MDTKEELKKFFQTYYIFAPTIMKVNEIRNYCFDNGLAWLMWIERAEGFYIYFTEDWKERLTFKELKERHGYVSYEEFKSKFMEETMSPEKEASKCQDESMDERISRIVDEKISEAVKELEKGLYASAPFETLGVKLDGGGAEPQLTQKENDILKGLHYLGWKWIARDFDGMLRIFEEKPFREDTEWQDEKDENYYSFLSDVPSCSDDDFQFVTWYDGPVLIADLIEE